MNNSLDKLISNDELLTYICLILGIFNTFLMSMVITSIKHNFNIYIFLLFEALFLIFIVYFILKKKDSYNKDDDIKYDWYFYLRISIITLVFFNFSLYIYNITNDSSTNPRKNGGGGSLSSFVGKSNRVAPAAPAAPTNIENEIKIKMLQEELEPLVSALTNDINKLNNCEIGVGSTDLLRKKIGNINAEISKLRASIRASRAPARAASRASRETSRAPAKAPRETSREPAREPARAQAREPARAPAREASREASNRVVQDPFPYQNSVSTTNPELTTRDIFRSDLPPEEKISLWGKLEKEKNEKKVKK